MSLIKKQKFLKTLKSDHFATLMRVELSDNVELVSNIHVEGNEMVRN